jgi:hypothetical protein
VDFTNVGLLLVISVTVPSIAVLAVTVVALRDSKPEERPEIIRALAALFGALRRRYPPADASNEAHPASAGSLHREPP